MAYVVNDWHEAAYEPIWDDEHKKVTGLLYVGIGMRAINADLRQTIQEMAVGKTGYAFVIVTKGDDRGRYLVSHKGTRDGELILDAKDVNGRFVIKEMLDKALSSTNGSVSTIRYLWKNQDDPAPRSKFSAVTYFAPWSWTICAGGYDDDFQEAAAEMTKAQTGILVWVGAASVLAMLRASSEKYALTILIGFGGLTFSSALCELSSASCDSVSAGHARDWSSCDRCGASS